ncbi:acyltransferase [Nocardia camponoti]|uniref:Acetyl/acyl transferase n=1 Tax=Nocardia camponoti TaxID=1616106 RepID=A0A917QDL5_9NOCA|nr:acetyl/acyl transferase [Nocardia camponoti]GGK43631.1 hypothetical protein GCM10011591_14050 [Nocardia camponoti]
MNVDDLYGPCYLSDSVVVGERCVLGYPKEARIRAAQQGRRSAGAPVLIGDRALLFNHVIVNEGTTVGADSVVEDRARLGYDCVVGDRVRIAHGAYLGDRVRVGDDCCVAGFVCDAAVIGDRSTVMGELVHEYSRPDLGWWGVDESAPVVESDAVVGFGARVVGGVRIGSRSYIAAGAIVSRDVPEGQVVTGVNIHVPLENWTGERLSTLIRVWRSPTPPEST